MELAPETINSLLEQGIALAYKVVPSLIYALLFLRNRPVFHQQVP